MTHITFRKGGQPVPIEGTIRCATCGAEFRADEILSVETTAQESRLAISHPPDHRASFSINSPDAVTLFVVHKR